MNDVMRASRGQQWTQAQYQEALSGIISRERLALRSGERQLNKHYRVDWEK
jgi:hypothetical protein